MIASFYITDLITWRSIFISLPYFIFFIIYQNRSANRQSDWLKPSYLKIAFYYHLLLALLSVIIIQYYYGFGDTCGYYSYGVEMRGYFHANQGEFWHKMASNMDWGTGRFNNLVAILNLICFDSYPAMMLFFCYFSFSGIMRFLMATGMVFPNLKKQVGWILFFLPSLHFYGAIVLKDTLMLGCVGWLFYATILIFHKKKYTVKYFALFTAMLILIAQVRDFIFITLLMSFIITVPVFLIKKLFTLNTPLLKKINTLLLLTLLFSIFAYFVTYNLTEQISDDFVKQIREQQNNFGKVKEEGDSGITLSINPDDIIDVSTLLKLSPEGFINGVFRPFPWDTKNLFAFLLSLESFALFLFFLYLFFSFKKPVVFKILISSKIILYFFCFVLVYGIIIGITTLNLGTIVRYRVPLLPFYVVVLIYISKYREFNTKGVTMPD